MFLSSLFLFVWANPLVDYSCKSHTVFEYYLNVLELTFIARMGEPIYRLLLLSGGL